MKFLRVFILKIALFSAPFYLTAQHEADNWFFGHLAGIRFTPSPQARQGNLDMLEGCSSISDSEGNLLFYTDGITIYDAQHNVMPGGSDLLGNPSSSQSGLIVPHPADSSLYFVFTVDAEGSYYGLRYTLVDMRLNGGRGAVVPGYKNIVLIYNIQEKITAIKNFHTGEVWVITLGGMPVTGSQLPATADPFTNENTIYAIKVGTGGIANEAVTTTFANMQGFYSNGYIKVSPDGNRIALAKFYDNLVYLTDFDKTTGKAFRLRSLPVPYNFAPYGVEFSPDNRYLYIQGTLDGGNILHAPVALLQYDLHTYPYAYVNLLPSDAEGYRSALQLAPDGKIYMTESYDYYTGADKLSVIANPNGSGTDAQVRRHAFSLLPGTLSHQGLPQFIQSFFSHIQTENACAGDTTFFTVYSSSPVSEVHWDFGDGSGTVSLPLPNNSHASRTSHVYASEGNYTVTAHIHTVGGNVIEERAAVEIAPLPKVELEPVYYLCNRDAVEIQAPEGYASYEWSTGDTGPQIRITAPGLYRLSVTNVFGCSTTISFKVVACVEVFQFFSPNGDNINETWHVENIEYYSNEVYIYNRWGNLVYYAQNYRNDWDGTANAGPTVSRGKKVPAGTYFYILYLQDFGIKTGYLYINY